MSDNLHEAVRGAVLDSSARVGHAISPDQVNQVVQLVMALIPLISQFVSIFSKKPVSQ